MQMEQDLVLTIDDGKKWKQIESLQKCHGFEEMMIRGVVVCDHTTSMLTGLLKNGMRIWNCIEILNCEGDFESIAAIAIKENKAKSMRLVNLEISSCRFESFGIALGKTRTLEQLRLTTSIGTGVAIPLGLGIRANMSLRCLDFKWSSFSRPAIINISHGLKHNMQLRRISFSGCNLEDDDVSSLITALHNHPSLEILDLNGNMCGQKTSAMISKLLVLSACNLKRLDLGYQCRHRERNFRGSPIIEALKRNKSLRFLDLSNNNMIDQDAEEFGSMMCSNRTLKFVNLSRNKLSENWFSLLASKLHMMISLKKLSLWGNQITEKSANKLFEGLRGNYSIESIDLFQRFNCSKQIQHLTLLNRGGRKIFRSPKNEIPLGLWPHILERVNIRNMSKSSLGTDDEDLRGKLEVLFYFLKGPVMLETK